MIEVRYKTDLSKKLARHKDWKFVLPILEELQASGYQALLAGGCVRDVLLGRSFSDIDVATSAKPEDIEKLFPNALGIGREFGVMMIPFEGGRVEVTTFREDLEYRDGRHPEGVKFSDAKADSRRRDFTVNALFYDVEKKTVFDFVSGMNDISDMILRVVGHPLERFEEDKLRLLRCVRFASQLGFEIESQTFKAVQKMAAGIESVSKERIQTELFKFAIGRYAHLACESFGQSKLWEALIPESSLKRDALGWKKIAKMFDRQQSEMVREDLRLTILFFPEIISEASILEIDHVMKRLKFSNQRTQKVTWILKMVGELSKDSVRKGKILSQMNRPEMLDAIDLWVAMDESTNGERMARAESFLKHGEPAKAFLSGEDLKKLGFQPGAQMGQILEEVYYQQLESKIKSKDEAIELATKLKNKS